MINLLTTRNVYDVIIIGGGIAGAGIARDASLRGLGVLLLEKNELGSGTSSRSSRLIHGGIRYLEIALQALLEGDWKGFQKNWHFVFASLRECRILERIAHREVRPLPLMIPFYRGRGRGRFQMILGAWMYYLLALFSGGGRMPRICWSAEAVLKTVPGLRREGLTGGILIWDRSTNDRQLVVAVAEDARHRGATVLEHMDVVQYRWDASSATYRVSAKDRSGKHHDFTGRTVVNASGPWLDRVRTDAGEFNRPYLTPVAGAHLTFQKFTPCSVILQAEDKRIFFCVDTGDFTRVGTTERPFTNPDTVDASTEDVQYLLESLNYYFPSLHAEEKDIVSMDAGIRPLAHEESLDRNPTRISREHTILRGPSGAFHVIGVKLTDHRRAAEDVVDQIWPEIQEFHPKRRVRSRTARTPLYAQSKDR